MSRQFSFWGLVEDWLAEVVLQALYPDVVVLANVFLEFLFCGPRNIPGDGPGPGVRTGVIDGGLIVHRALVWPGYLFDHVELIGMRMTPLVQPSRFVVSNAIDNQRVAFPMANRVPQVCLAVNGIERGMRTPI